MGASSLCPQSKVTSFTKKRKGNDFTLGTQNLRSKERKACAVQAYYKIERTKGRAAIERTYDQGKDSPLNFTYKLTKREPLAR